MIRGDERRGDRRREAGNPPPELAARLAQDTAAAARSARPVTDLRRTIRQSLRQGGEILSIARNRRQTRVPPLVVLCDISGSMSRYAQILLHFLHAVTNDRDRVHVFLFGTRLTNITRQLRPPRPGGGVPDHRPCRARLVRRHPDR